MTRQYSFDDSVCEFRYVHASGPGGQHVNKTATAVELRVAVIALSLPAPVTQRLRAQQRNRINARGELIIQAEQYRSQLKNKQDALTRLQRMIDAARVAPKKRIATKPTTASRRRRLDNKKKRGATKATRRKPSID